MKDIRKFLEKLSQELHRNEDFDIEARQILKDLHDDAEQIEESDGLHIEQMLTRINELESRFAANHPTLEKTIRELADALARMGI